MEIVSKSGLPIESLSSVAITPKKLVSVSTSVYAWLPRQAHRTSASNLRNATNGMLADSHIRVERGLERQRVRFPDSSSVEIHLSIERDSVSSHVYGLLRGVVGSAQKTTLLHTGSVVAAHEYTHDCQSRFYTIVCMW